VISKYVINIEHSYKMYEASINMEDHLGVLEEIMEQGRSTALPLAYQ